MRTGLMILVCLVGYSRLWAQTEAGIEQYHYIGTTESATVVPVLHYQTKKGWYGEVRYNYDERNTFSILGGKTFSTRNNIPFSFTPMAGITFGELNGYTAGINISVEKSSFFFGTQSQYTVSTTKKYGNFIFNWCELGYQPLNWMYAGLSLQHTQVYGEKPLWEPGLMLGFSFKQVSFPLYAFNTFNNNRFFILGVNWEWSR